MQRSMKSLLLSVVEFCLGPVFGHLLIAICWLKKLEEKETPLAGWLFLANQPYPKHSMYAIYAYIDPPNHPNVGKYGIHGAFGL